MNISTLTFEMLEDCEVIKIWRYRECRIGWPNTTLVRWQHRVEDNREQVLHQRLAPSPECDNHQVIEVKLTTKHGGHHIHLLFSDNNLYASESSTLDSNEYTWEKKSV